MRAITSSPEFRYVGPAYVYRGIYFRGTLLALARSQVWSSGSRDLDSWRDDEEDSTRRDSRSQRRPNFEGVSGGGSLGIGSGCVDMGEEVKVW